MRATEATEAALVVAAQSGDAHALDELVAACLPLVYSVVGRALGTRADVDDVVQETMLRALRDLSTLRTPESFRVWLVTIAIRQAGTYRQRSNANAARTTALDEAAGRPDDNDFESVTILRLGLSGQRRQAVEACRWLDSDNRAVQSLWWLEAAGHLSRTDLAAALGLTVAHAGVRVQRMREQFDVCRSVVAAIEASRRCGALDAVLAGWDGRPGPLWRKRIGRHARACATCGAAAADLVPAEGLLLALALVPVPLALTLTLLRQAGLAGTGQPAGTGVGVGAGAKAGLLSQSAHAVVAHPLLVLAITGGLVAGTVVTTDALPSRRPAAVAAQAGGPVPAIQDPGGSAAPAPRAPLGRLSLESANAPGRYVALSDDVGMLSSVDPASPGPARVGATFEAVAGLAGSGCVSFRVPDGRYLRHSSWRLRVDADDGTVLFHGDATFCARRGPIPGTTSWESYNYPGWFLRHVGDVLWVDRSDGSAAFDDDSSFHVRAPLAG
jgi:RNA polymerase sigma factor (sigma-70 family)